MESQLEPGLNGVMEDDITHLYGRVFKIIDNNSINQKKSTKKHFLPMFRRIFLNIKHSGSG